MGYHFRDIQVPDFHQELHFSFEDRDSLEFRTLCDNSDGKYRSLSLPKMYLKRFTAVTKNGSENVFKMIDAASKFMKEKNGIAEFGEYRQHVQVIAGFMKGKHRSEGDVIVLIRRDSLPTSVGFTPTNNEYEYDQNRRNVSDGTYSPIQHNLITKSRSYSARSISFDVFWTE